MDFQHGYTPPGVTVTEDVSPVVSVSGLPPTVVALVGPSVGYRATSEQVTLGQGVFLSKQGIDVSSIEVTVVGSGEVLTVTTDYTTHVTGNPADGTQTYTVDLTRVATGALGDTDTPVFVSYRYTDPEYFTPKAYDNFEDVKAAYGEPLNLVAAQPGDTDYRPVLSPLTLAASLTFLAGASSVVLVPTAPDPSSATTAAAVSTARKDALADAYESIETDESITVVVPLTDGILDADAAAVYNDLRAHLEAATNEGNRRVGLLGFDASLTIAPDALLEAASSKTKRIFLSYAGPQGMRYYNGAINTFLNLGHQYPSAVAAGVLAVNPVQQGLTNQPVPGFSGIAGTPISNALKNQYAAAGVAIIEVKNRRTVYRHGTTTDPSNVNTRELSVVRARDTMVSFLENGFVTSALIGSPMETTTLQSVKAVAAGLLEHLKLTGTILDYSDLGVRQSSSEPTVIEVRFAYKPSYPLNYINVVFSIDMTTGSVDDTTDLLAA